MSRGDCHVLGHRKPCTASVCAEIEREHEAVRQEALRRVFDEIGLAIVGIEATGTSVETERDCLRAVSKIREKYLTAAPMPSVACECICGPDEQNEWCQGQTGEWARLIHSCPVDVLRKIVAMHDALPALPTKGPAK